MTFVHERSVPQPPLTSVNRPRGDDAQAKKSRQARGPGGFADEADLALQREVEFAANASGLEMNRA
jgi:hypothetical protein